MPRLAKNSEACRDLVFIFCEDERALVEIRASGLFLSRAQKNLSRDRNIWRVFDRKTPDRAEADRSAQATPCGQACCHAAMSQKRIDGGWHAAECRRREVPDNSSTRPIQ